MHGLDEVSARALLATVYSGPFDDSVRARIIEETRGNPLALLELFNATGPAELAGGFALRKAMSPDTLKTSTSSALPDCLLMYSVCFFSRPPIPPATQC